MPLAELEKLLDERGNLCFVEKREKRRSENAIVFGEMKCCRSRTRVGWSAFLLIACPDSYSARDIAFARHCRSREKTKGKAFPVLEVAPQGEKRGVTSIA